MEKNQAEPEKNISYTKLAFFFFVIRTVVIGLALLSGPYFALDDETTTFKMFIIFLDITNILQFIFQWDIIQRKILFQYLLYIPVLAYSLTLTITLIVDAHNTNSCNFKVEGKIKKLAIGYIYTYMGILLGKVALLPIIYRRLKSDFMWANFKKLGANTAINGKWR
ncbi:hypothetical protein GPK93_08g14020 [Encephalitozoon intestinalis]|nr:hypothetical protein GPK93_08g14020 [Encephalitozoon intestinalis]